MTALSLADLYLFIYKIKNSFTVRFAHLAITKFSFKVNIFAIYTFNTFLVRNSSSVLSTFELYLNQEHLSHQATSFELE